jgi:hypothetical protein
MNIPDNIASIELAVGDANDNDQVDVSCSAEILGHTIVNFRKDLDLVTAFRLLGVIRKTTEALKRLLP